MEHSRRTSSELGKRNTTATVKKLQKTYSAGSLTGRNLSDVKFQRPRADSSLPPTIAELSESSGRIERNLTLDTADAGDVGQTKKGRKRSPSSDVSQHNQRCSRSTIIGRYQHASTITSDVTNGTNIAGENDSPISKRTGVTTDLSWVSAHNLSTSNLPQIILPSLKSDKRDIPASNITPTSMRVRNEAKEAQRT